MSDVNKAMASLMSATSINGLRDVVRAHGIPIPDGHAKVSAEHQAFWKLFRERAATLPESSAKADAGRGPGLTGTVQHGKVMGR
ncbi:MAG: hypothetical protein KA297_22880 [Kofleriaceae bacterium]|nr:hypothetical protein [Kofleriaceae bacterium]